MGVKLQSALGGSVELNPPSTASNFTLNVPAGNGTVATTDQLANFRNRIINGNMGIWQRGTTFAAIGTSVYTVDRWHSTIAGSSLSLTSSRSTSVPSPDFAYSLQYQQIGSTATSVTDYAARQRFELANVRDLAGKIVTISFWYRSNIVGTHGVRILPIGTTGGVDTKVAITVNSANTWEYKTVTTNALSAVTSWGSTADNATALILDIGLRVSGVGQTTVAANTYFNLTGVQLEAGSVATPFERRPFSTELDLCQRYYTKTYELDTAPGTAAGAGYAGAIRSTSISTTSYMAFGNWRFPTRMRSFPSIDVFNPRTGVVDSFAADASDFSGVGVGTIGQTGAQFFVFNRSVGTDVFIQVAATATAELF
jgi:hypothetical protein